MCMCCEYLQHVYLCACVLRVCSTFSSCVCFVRICSVCVCVVNLMKRFFLIAYVFLSCGLLSFLGHGTFYLNVYPYTTFVTIFLWSQSLPELFCILIVLITWSYITVGKKISVLLPFHCEINYILNQNISFKLYIAVNLTKEQTTTTTTKHLLQ